jgi:predicted Zn-dependent protease with MMP-like domain
VERRSAAGGTAIRAWQAGGVIDISERRFEDLVETAIAGIPEDLRSRMDNVSVFVEDNHPSGRLLGLYEGIPLTRREQYGALVMPDRITIYRLPLLSVSRTEEELVEQVRRTVVHEVAHHFGISDARLRDLGYG